VNYTETDPLAAEPAKAPAVRNYVFVGLAAVIVFVLATFARGAEAAGLLAAVFAVAGLLARWASGPFLFAVIAGYLLMDPYGLHWASFFSGYRSLRTPARSADAELDLGSLLIVLAVLIYLMAQYRVFSLLAHAVPTDPRRLADHRNATRPPRLGRHWRRIPPPVDPSARRDPHQKRSPRAVAESELPQMLAVAAACVLGAQIAWAILARFEPAFEMEPRYARLMLLIWLVGVGVMIASAGLGYLAMRRAPPDEAAMYLQDELWKETRREQQRVQRWRVWGRARRKGQEGVSG
jgi:hypothetical protein